MEVHHDRVGGLEAATPYTELLTTHRPGYLNPRRPHENGQKQPTEAVGVSSSSSTFVFRRKDQMQRPLGLVVENYVRSFCSDLRNVLPRSSMAGRFADDPISTWHLRSPDTSTQGQSSAGTNDQQTWGWALIGNIGRAKIWRLADPEHSSLLCGLLCPGPRPPHFFSCTV